MKSLIFIFIYILVFCCVFILLSCIGLIITNLSFLDIIRNNSWFGFYSFFIGWWIPVFSCREYYIANKDYFEEIF
jgi:hypothetical protein